MKVAILGGGVAGLSAAIALRLSGLEVDVYERRRAAQHLGAGVVCWPNASFVLSELGVLDRVRSAAGRVSAMRRVSSSGELLGRLDVGRLDAAMGFPSYAILRSDLMRVLHRRVDRLRVPVHFGACAAGIESGGRHRCRVRFDDGASITANLVLGADGRMRSVARQFVTGDNKPAFQGVVNWIGVFEARASLFGDMAVRDYWGVGARFGIVPVSERQAYWAGGAATASQAEPSNQSRRDELQALFSGWPEPIPEIIAQADNGNTSRIVLYDHDPILRWHKNNVLLLGDAAHAALPTSGQGAAQALEDAWVLAREIQKSPTDLEQVMNSFTRVRSQKTAGITMGARGLARSLFSTDPLACTERDTQARALDYSAMAEGMAKGWGAGLPLGV